MGPSRQARETALNSSSEPISFTETVRRRRMVRNFTDEPVERSVVSDLLDLARRSPSAGFSQGIHYLVLDGAEVGEFWDITLPRHKREDFPWPGLLKAPTIVIPLAEEAAYRRRYSESDKAHTGLGEGDWPVPYWLVDTSMATMTLLHAVVEAELGALFFGIFEGTDQVLAHFGVPAGLEPIGAVAIGHKAQGDRPSRSTRRGRRDESEVVHWSNWEARD